MAHNNGRIYTETVGGVKHGVSICDVQTVLGNSSPDLGTLCRAANINPWARYKPVYIATSNEHSTPVLLTDAVRLLFGWGSKTKDAYIQTTWGTVADFADTIMGHNVSPHPTRAEIETMAANGFIELLPVPVSMFARLGDFVKTTATGSVDGVGYDHNAVPADGVVKVGSSEYRMASELFQPGSRSITIVDGSAARFELPDDKTFLNNLAAVLHDSEAGEFVTHAERLSPVEIIAGQDGYTQLFGGFDPDHPNEGANAVRGIMLFQEDVSGDTYQLVSYQYRDNYERSSGGGLITKEDNLYYSHLTFTITESAVYGYFVDIEGTQTETGRRTITDEIITAIARKIVYGETLPADAAAVVTGGDTSVPYYGSGLSATDAQKYLKKVITLIYGAVIKPCGKYLDLTYKGLQRVSDRGYYGPSGYYDRIYKPDQNHPVDEDDVIDGRLLAVEFYLLLYPVSAAGMQAAVIPGYSYFIDITRVGSDYAPGLDYADLVLLIWDTAISSVAIQAETVTGGSGWASIIGGRYDTLYMDIYSGTTLQRTINLLSTTPDNTGDEDTFAWAYYALSTDISSCDKIVLRGTKTGSQDVKTKTFTGTVPGPFTEETNNN